MSPDVVIGIDDSIVDQQLERSEPSHDSSLKHKLPRTSSTSSVTLDASIHTATENNHPPSLPAAPSSSPATQQDATSNNNNNHVGESGASEETVESVSRDIVLQIVHSIEQVEQLKEPPPAAHSAAK